VLGIAWQTSLVLIPICLVIRKFEAALIAAAIVVGASLVLKLTWYDHLEAREARGTVAAGAGGAPAT
jgi:hypothetical protein